MNNPYLERDLYQLAFDHSIEYLEQLPDRRVSPDSEAVDRLDQLIEPLPTSGSEPAEVIETLNRIVSPANMAMNGPRFFGFVIGGSYPVSLAANWLAGTWDQATGIYRVTPATALVEKVAIDWLIELFGLPPNCAGGVVTGATVANFTALAAARNAVLGSVGWDVESDGLIGAPDISVIVSEEYHPSVMKALGMVGLGRNRVVTLPVDHQGRIKPEKLPPVLGPTIVCLQAGNVNSGGFDPFDKIVDHFHRVRGEHRVWIHIDGAFGLWATASRELDSLTKGIQRADSWATDAHKWLNVPYDSGVVFVREPSHVESAMAVTAEYLPMQTPHRNPSDFVPELSRRARGVEIWATLKYLGRPGVSDLVDRCCRHARMFATAFQEAGYEVLNDVVLNQVLVSFGEPALTGRIIEQIQNDGTCWCGGTVWQGQTAMRVSTSNWATGDDDIERSINTILQIAGSNRAE